ncbi:MAG TPA: glutathione peroxidase [Chitinophagaceae bacterium]|nr:glutathione peroxidase [Chitinophagaceae bacterium]
MKKLRKILLVICMLLIVFAGYVELVNWNSKGMTYRQKLLKAVYPVWMWLGRLTNRNAVQLSNPGAQPKQSFYSLKAELNDGRVLDFETLKGKKVLIVNTASDCGYTTQYSQLQKLYESRGGKLEIIGFPANDFKNQEKGTDSEIAEFCRRNFGVNFPIAKKTSVRPSTHQHPVFQWLTDAALNGWNSQAPTWNFTKYLVSEQGLLTHCFGPSVSPLGRAVLQHIE